MLWQLNSSKFYIKVVTYMKVEVFYKTKNWKLPQFFMLVGPAWKVETPEVRYIGV